MLPSLYVCQVCWRRICQSCFIPEERACERCAPTVEKAVGAAPRGVELGLLLTLAGLGLTFLGILVISLALLADSQAVSGGIVILIGPFPIALGFGPAGLSLLALALLAAAVILLTLLLWPRTRRPHRAPARSSP